MLLQWWYKIPSLPNLNSISWSAHSVSSPFPLNTRGTPSRSAGSQLFTLGSTQRLLRLLIGEISNRESTKKVKISYISTIFWTIKILMFVKCSHLCFHTPCFARLTFLFIQVLDKLFFSSIWKDRYRYRWVGMLNTVKIYWTDVSSVSTSFEKG